MAEHQQQPFHHVHHHSFYVLNKTGKSRRFTKHLPLPQHLHLLVALPCVQITPHIVIVNQNSIIVATKEVAIGIRRCLRHGSRPRRKRQVQRLLLVVQQVRVLSILLQIHRIMMHIHGRAVWALHLRNQTTATGNACSGDNATSS